MSPIFLPLCSSVPLCHTRCAAATSLCTSLYLVCLHYSSGLSATALQEAQEEPDAEEVKEAAPTVSGEASSFSFEAETKQLLDIVANSLYTDKEVQIRISQSTDMRSATV